jgi:hypothetical protein
LQEDLRQHLCQNNSALSNTTTWEGFTDTFIVYNKSPPPNTFTGGPSLIVAHGEPWWPSSVNTMAQGGFIKHLHCFQQSPSPNTFTGESTQWHEGASPTPSSPTTNHLLQTPVHETMRVYGKRGFAIIFTHYNSLIAFVNSFCINANNGLLS